MPDLATKAYFDAKLTTVILTQTVAVGAMLTVTVGVILAALS
jgi:hypothetical protein